MVIYLVGGDKDWLQTPARRVGERRRLEVAGGRYRIRTYDFHRVKMALYR
jgi:hypothetical protein